MKVCHLFVTVNHDGLGDFSHFVDIYTALMKDPDLNKMEFIPVVYVVGEDEEKLKKINATLRSLEIPLYFSGHSAAFKEPSQNHKELIDTLKKSAQILFISYDSLYDRYKNNINPNTILKTINEHEGRVALTVPNSRKRSMGLAEGCYGIKISNFTPLSLSESSSIIADNDPNFWGDLCRYTDSRSLEDFTGNNTLVSAYFNDTIGFMRFLKFLVTHDLDKKNIALYFSGAALNSEYITQSYALNSIAELGNVRIELITKDNSAPIVYNPGISRVIRVFSEYKVSDSSYRALYSNARIAGVSGDNTLEYAIAHNVFPFYISTNFTAKEHTLWGLKKISQLEELPISNEARSSFDIYFNPNYYSGRLLVNDSTSKVNLMAMIEAWPHIASYIKTQKNFYTELKRIVLEGLPEKVLDASHFNQHLELIHMKIDEFEKKIQSTNNHDYFLAQQEALRLYSKLKTAQTDLLSTSQPIQEQALIFQKTCLKAINDSRFVLEKHRGFKQILANIASVNVSIATLGIVNLVTSRGMFDLFVTKTDSSKKLDNLKKDLEENRYCLAI
jgi:hypothetical protein